MIKIDFIEGITNNDYIHFGRIYIYKYVFYVSLIVLISIPLLFFENPYTLLFGKDSLALNEYVYHDKRLQNTTGMVKVKDDNNQIRYEGQIVNGVCQGQGKLYDGKGQLIYQGGFVNNVFEDENGSLYNENGNILYTGGFKQNQYEGQGTVYNKEGKLDKEGTFIQGKLTGEGTVYKNNGEILYTGNFLNDKYDKQGTLYDKYTNRILYQGEFSNNLMEGQGQLFDTTGFMYYQGAMHEDSIDYTSFLNATLQQVEDSFKHHYEIFIYKDMTLFVYRKENILFITHNPITINYASRKQVKDDLGNDQFIEEVELDKAVDKADIIIDSILISDPTILPIVPHALLIETVEKELYSYGVGEEEVQSNYPMFLKLMKQLDVADTITTPKIGSFVYLFNHPIASTMKHYIYAIENIQYTYGAKMDGTLSYVLIENHIRKKK